MGVSDPALIEELAAITTSDGETEAFVVYPAGGGPAPVVLFYMDAYGLREELREMARRIAGWGYLVVLPNLYYRVTSRFEARDEDPESIRRAGELMFGVGNRMVARDTEALLGFVDDHVSADARRIGCVGYCMSGPFVVTAAAAYPQRIACAASVYGAALVTERHDSPHLMLDRARGELCFVCAGIDEWAPPEKIEELRVHLERAGVKHRILWHEGAQHGFAFPSRRGKYDPVAAERHWTQLRALFDRVLKAA